MTEFIWLDDESNVELGFLVNGTTKRPGIPNTVDRTLPIPGRNGLWDFGADIGARTFIIDGVFNTRNAFELQKCISRLAEHLLDGYGKPRTMEIRFRERPDQYLNVRLTGGFDIDRIMGLGIFSLSLTAFDPYAYLITDPILDSDILLDSELKLDGEYHLFQVTGPQVVGIGNSGTLAIRPEITVTGSFTTLTLSTGGTTFTFTKPLLAGQTLTIDGPGLKVNIDGVNKLHEMTGDFIDVMPGSNDVIVTGTNINCLIDFYIPAKFI